MINKLRSVVYKTLVVQDRKGTIGGAYRIRYKATWFCLEINYVYHIIERHNYMISKLQLDHALEQIYKNYLWFMNNPIGTRVKLPTGKREFPLILYRTSNRII